MFPVKFNRNCFSISILTILVLQIGVTLKIIPQIWPFVTYPMFKTPSYEGKRIDQYSLLAITKDSTEVKIKPEDITPQCHSTDPSFFPPEKLSLPQSKNPQTTLTELCLFTITFGLRNGRYYPSLEYDIWVNAVLQDEKDIINRYLSSYQDNTQTQVRELKVINETMILRDNGLVSEKQTILKTYSLY